MSQARFLLQILCNSPPPFLLLSKPPFLSDKGRKRTKTKELYTYIHKTSLVLKYARETKKSFEEWLDDGSNAGSSLCRLHILRKEILPLGPSLEESRISAISLQKKKWIAMEAQTRLQWVCSIMHENDGLSSLHGSGKSTGWSITAPQRLASHVGTEAN